MKLQTRVNLQVPPHKAGDTFVNPWLAKADRRGPLDVLKWALGLGPDERPAVEPSEVPKYRPRIVEPDLTRIHNPVTDAVQVTWIGHATFLIQVDGLNILTDPIFSERASPVSFAGPRRHAPPGIPFERLPPIDAVILSHNHYDHLDKSTVARLGNAPAYFVPQGLRKWFEGEGITNVTELDWGRQSEWRGLTWTSVPVQHFSGRFPPHDQDKSLWTAWVLGTSRGNVYFGGDTGYGPFFKETARAFGPMRLALLPIGAYRPRWFMQPMHMDPAEAVEAHLDLEAASSIGMHWGTFNLTDEPLGEPPIYLEKVKQARGLPEDSFRVMAFGETLVLR